MIVSKKKYEKLRLQLEQSEKDLGDFQMDFSVQIDKARRVICAYKQDKLDLERENASLKDKSRAIAEENTALKAELAELKKANEWQPIETAPKIEGDSLILWGSFENNLDLGRFCTCRWWQDDDCENGYWVTGGELFTPTHWKPLPQPPETQSRLEAIDELARLGQECDRLTESQAMTMDDYVAAEAAAFGVGKESEGE